MNSYACIVTAAGRGTRLGGGLPKQWRDLAGRSVLARAVDAMRPHGRVIVTVHPDDMTRAVAEFGGSVTLVAGGGTRSQSVHAALESLAGSGVSHVLIHDGARPLVAQAVIAAVVAALDGGAQAAAPGVALSDALWRVADGRVQASVDRGGLVRAQTPQGFRLDAILAAHRACPEGGADDVELACRCGIAVAVTPGCADNLKITTPGDMERALATLRRNG